MKYLNRDAVIRDLEEHLEYMERFNRPGEYHEGFVEGFRFCIDRLKEHKTVQHRTQKEDV